MESSHEDVVQYQLPIGEISVEMNQLIGDKISLKYQGKIKSLDFEKEPLVSGILTGIKGQYLMFEGNRVINIRKYGGYYVRFQASG